MQFTLAKSSCHLFVHWSIAEKIMKFIFFTKTIQVLSVILLASSDNDKHMLMSQKIM